MCGQMLVCVLRSLTDALKRGVNGFPSGEL